MSDEKPSASNSISDKPPLLQPRTRTDIELGCSKATVMRGGSRQFDCGRTTPGLETYQHAANSLRRLLESLGIHRGRLARDVTSDLGDYMKDRGSRIIDHEDAA
jgi:hypothetical protein